MTGVFQMSDRELADGPVGLASHKRGRPSNRKRGEIFRTTAYR